jgi:hypothetical protein
MKKVLLIITFLQCTFAIQAQNDVYIDGRLQPVLDSFFEYCKKYEIDYSEKLFQLESITIVDTLPLSKYNTVLGKVLRNEEGNINKIVINWAALFDKEILNVVAFHEFAHHFLDYKHTCHDCNEIMAETNPSYFDIARDWGNQVEYMFTTSPVYLKNHKDTSIASN